MPKEIIFLELEEVLKFHKVQINVFGGSHGIRDIGLLESAMASPQASFGGEYLHGNIFEMASAYLYHIIKNHPFIDGNKRTGIIAAIIFLKANNNVIIASQEDIFELAVNVANSKLSKEELAFHIKALTKSK